MNLVPVRDRLRNQAMPPLKLVDGAAALAALKVAPPKELQPAAYVLPVSDSGSPNRRVNRTVQELATIFGVVLVLGSARDPRGADATDEIEAVRAPVRAALLGWQPTGDDSPIVFLSGRLTLVRDGTLWWLDEWRTAADIRD